MSATLTVKIDEDVKKSAEEALKEIGINWTNAINVYARAIAEERRIPIELKARTLKEYKIPKVKGAKRIYLKTNKHGVLQLPEDSLPKWKMDAWEM